MGLNRLGIYLLAAFSAHAGMLVTVDETARRMVNGNLVLLHVGTPKDYEAGHLPGARLVTLADISVTGEGGLRLQMPPLDQLKANLEKLGISNGTPVVIYAGGDSVQAVTRVWFTFDYLGLGAQASVLDGGLAAWRAAGKSESKEAPEVKPGSLQVTPRPELIVDAAWIKAHLDDAQVAIFDARLPQFFSGAEAGQMPRAGRIPGARNVPYTSLVDEQRKMLPAQELKAKLGADGKTLVSYCHIGLQATVLYFAARMLDLNARLYDGSFQDWSQRTELPVQTGQ